MGFGLSLAFAGGFKPQFIPSITGISTLFSRTLTAASLWVHVLAINLFLARTIFCEGELFGLSVRYNCEVFNGWEVTHVLGKLCGRSSTKHVCTCALAHACKAAHEARLNTPVI